MAELILLIIVGTTIWVGIDAHSAGRTGGSVFGWVIGAILLWIVVFPCYLVSRGKFDPTPPPRAVNYSPPPPVDISKLDL